ncbi:MAG TPA: hypothetical protein VGJ21_10120 [Terracidiphilus sp.]|jgi:hypothetical protein
MTPDEVRLVINGWLENQSQLVLVAQLWGFSVALRCRVAFLNAEWTVGLLTSDAGRIGVELSEPGTEFKYAEPREFPELVASSGLSAAQRVASSITILFPPRESSDGEDREVVSLIELID